jgi:hypothetical protein
MKKHFIIETVETYHNKYIVETEKELKQAFLQNTIDRTGMPRVEKGYLGERVIGMIPIKEDDIVTKFNKGALECVLDIDKPIGDPWWRIFDE